MVAKGFTERQKSLIDFCKSAGYGWGRFALSVESQGYCTHKQQETLIKMHQKIQHAMCVKAGNFRSQQGCWDSDISDSEAYRSGDYF